MGTWSRKNMLTHFLDPMYSVLNIPKPSKTLNQRFVGMTWKANYGIWQWLNLPNPTLTPAPKVSLKVKDKPMVVLSQMPGRTQREGLGEPHGEQTGSIRSHQGSPILPHPHLCPHLHPHLRLRWTPKWRTKWMTRSLRRKVAQ